MGLFDRLLGRKPKRSGDRPDFSNVSSGASSTAPAPAGGPRPPGPGVPPPPVGGGPRNWVVRPGDTLSHIAEEVYGDASQWRRIYDANRSQIDDPDLIHPDQTLVIPVAPKEASS